MRRTFLWLLVPMVALLLAGCGTPDEQEADENEASEQESVGEGEVPGPGALGVVGAVLVAAGFAVWKRRRS